MSFKKLFSVPIIILFFFISALGIGINKVSAAELMNKLFLDPQMSWPVQWDKVKGKPGNFWVCGQNSGFITIFDAQTRERIARIDFWQYEKDKLIKAGKTIDKETEDFIQKNIKPHHVWVAPGAEYIYVTNNAKKSDNFWIVENKKPYRIIKTLNSGAMGPLHGAFSPIEDLAIFGNVQDKKKGIVTFIDTAKHEVVGTIKTSGTQTRDVNITHDGKLAFVNNQGYNKEKGNLGSIEVIDIKARKIINNIPAHGTKGMAMSKDGKLIVVAAKQIGAVYIIDVESQKILTKLDTGGKPSNVSFHPNGKKVYVGVDKKGYVVIDLETRSIIKTIKGGKQANALYFPPGRDDIAFAANEKDTFISVIDTKNDKLIKELETPLGSHNIRFNPEGTVGFATCKKSNEAVWIDVGKLEVDIQEDVGFGNNGVRWVPAM